jgi:hypothetical protein
MSDMSITMVYIYIHIEVCQYIYILQVYKYIQIHVCKYTKVRPLGPWGKPVKKQADYASFYKLTYNMKSTALYLQALAFTAGRHVDRQTECQAFLSALGLRVAGQSNARTDAVAYLLTVGKDIFIYIFLCF